jgi:hypothetical protein
LLIVIVYIALYTNDVNTSLDTNICKQYNEVINEGEYRWFINQCSSLSCM